MLSGMGFESSCHQREGNFALNPEFSRQIRDFAGRSEHHRGLRYAVSWLIRPIGSHRARRNRCVYLRKNERGDAKIKIPLVGFMTLTSVAQFAKLVRVIALASERSGLNPRVAGIQRTSPRYVPSSLQLLN